jgi:hypothetical protein
MQAEDDDLTRPETLLAAVIYLMTHYSRTRCPRIANCISRHLQCLAAHPRAAPVVRDMCAALIDPWSPHAGAPAQVH